MTRTLPITKVCLYSKGNVGFFERTGSVIGTAPLAWRVGAEELYDVVKSLTVLDVSGRGTVTSVSYETVEGGAGAKDGGARSRLATGSLSDLLNDLKGARVRVEAGPPGAAPVEGAVLSAYTSGEGEAREMLSLLSEDGRVVPVPLRSIASLSVLDENLRRGVRDHLEALLGCTSSSLATTRYRTVSAACVGEGPRSVVASYAARASDWRVSYRLLLSTVPPSPSGSESSQGGPPATGAVLQALAVVKNQTEDDWEDVQLSLVSGEMNRMDTDLLGTGAKAPAASSSSSGGEVIQLFVKTLTGKTVTVEPRTGSTVEKVKELIMDKEGIAVGQQGLIIAGKQVEKGRGLADLSIQRARAASNAVRGGERAERTPARVHPAPPPPPPRPARGARGPRAQPRRRRRGAGGRLQRLLHVPRQGAGDGQAGPLLPRPLPLERAGVPPGHRVQPQRAPVEPDDRPPLPQQRRGAAGGRAAGGARGGGLRRRGRPLLPQARRRGDDHVRRRDGGDGGQERVVRSRQAQGGDGGVGAGAGGAGRRGARPCRRLRRRAPRPHPPGPRAQDDVRLPQPHGARHRDPVRGALRSHGLRAADRRGQLGARRGVQPLLPPPGPPRDAPIRGAGAGVRRDDGGADGEGGGLVARGRPPRGPGARRRAGGAAADAAEGRPRRHRQGRVRAGGAGGLARGGALPGPAAGGRRGRRLPPRGQGGSGAAGGGGGGGGGGGRREPAPPAGEPQGGGGRGGQGPAGALSRPARGGGGPAVLPAAGAAGGEGGGGGAGGAGRRRAGARRQGRPRRARRPPPRAAALLTRGAGRRQLGGTGSLSAPSLPPSVISPPRLGGGDVDRDALKLAPADVDSSASKSHRATGCRPLPRPPGVL